MIFEHFPMPCSFLPCLCIVFNYFSSFAFHICCIGWAEGIFRWRLMPSVPLMQPPSPRSPVVALHFLITAHAPHSYAHTGHNDIVFTPIYAGSYPVHYHCIQSDNCFSGPASLTDIQAKLWHCLVLQLFQLYMCLYMHSQSVNPSDHLLHTSHLHRTHTHTHITRLGCGNNRHCTENATFYKFIWGVRTWHPLRVAGAVASTHCPSVISSLNSFHIHFAAVIAT